MIARTRTRSRQPIPEADVADPIRELVEYTHSWMFGGTNPKEKAPWSDVRWYYSRHEGPPPDAPVTEDTTYAQLVQRAYQYLDSYRKDFRHEAVTADEAALILGMSGALVRMLCQEMDVERFGNAWIIDADTLKKLKRRNVRRGRPPVKAPPE